MDETDQDYLISNGAYDVLKRIVTLGLPALATLYASLAALWDFPNPEAVVGTFAALATFGGVLLTISTKSWNNSEGKYDGELITTGNDPDTGIPSLELNVTKDPNEFVNKRTIRLRSIDAR